MRASTRKAVSRLDRHTVRIDIAYGGSCTAGKKEDMDMYALVLKAGLERGERVSEGVEFWIQFGSQEVKEYCREQGYLEIFEILFVKGFFYKVFKYGKSNF